MAMLSWQVGVRGVLGVGGVKANGLTGVGGGSVMVC